MSRQRGKTQNPAAAWVTCRHCGRRAYRSRAEAKLAARGRSTGDRGKLHPYRCPKADGPADWTWHLGTMSMAQSRAWYSGDHGAADAAIDPMTVRLAGRCRCGKIAALNEAQARAFADAIAREAGTRSLVWFYACPSSGRQHWHWTRTPHDGIAGWEAGA